MPVVATPERVVWVAGHRAADDLLVTGTEAPAMVLEMEAGVSDEPAGRSARS